MSEQPDSNAETITIPAEHIEATLARLKALGGVLLGFSVQGNTYLCTVIMPPAQDIERAMEDKPCK